MIVIRIYLSSQTLKMYIFWELLSDLMKTIIYTFISTIADLTRESTFISLDTQSQNYS